MLWNADGSRFGGTDVLEAGELGLSPDNAPLTRIRNPSANRIQFQDDNTAFSLSDYFIVDEGQDALITFQTIDGAVSFEVNGNVAASPTPNARRITFETPAALDTLLASLAVTDSLLIAIELPVPRHNLTLGETFPIFTATVNVHTRAPARKEVQASKTFPALTATATVLETEELTAARPSPRSLPPPRFRLAYRCARRCRRLRRSPPFTAAANVLGTKALTAAATFPAFSATLTLDQRNPPRQIVTADKTFGAFTATATVLSRRPITAASNIPMHSQRRPPFNSARQIGLNCRRQRPSRRSVLPPSVYQTERVEADKTFPAFTATATVQTRAPARIPITAVATFPAFTTMATVARRIPVAASGTFPAFTSTATVQTRMPMRQTVEAAATFPAFTATAVVGKRIPITASATFPALAATVDVEISTVTRHEITADKTFPAMAATVAVYQTERVEASAPSRPSRQRRLFRLAPPRRKKSRRIRPSPR